MPVVMQAGSAGRSFALLPGVHCAPRAASMRRDAIEIGIVNNMPDAALEATERQFIGLLAAASERTSVRVKLFAGPDVPRSDAARRYVADHYADLSELRDSRLDGLIVTGTEPRGALEHEPYWAALTNLVEWAQRNTTSTIWSCLAAHAAVLHLDGIARVALPDKCFGVFQCERAGDHPLSRATPEMWHVPHSRWNDLPVRELEKSGYGVLSRSPEVGVDMFTKETGSLFVFLQGHPEYEASTLLREFRRDVGRFLRGERTDFPAPPQHYFDRASARAIDDFRARALAEPNEALLESFPAMAARQPLVSAWRAAAVRLYRNWLGVIMGRRVTPRMSTAVHANA
jgi:homoserine O-succinyltransferase/O-acetyltransferase